MFKLTEIYGTAEPGITVDLSGAVLTGEAWITLMAERERASSTQPYYGTAFSDARAEYARQQLRYQRELLSQRETDDVRRRAASLRRT